MEEDIFNLSKYDFGIPQNLIAQEPHIPRDHCRLLMVNRKNHKLSEAIFKDIIDFFEEGDLLVLNNTKVIKARLLGKKLSGAKIEVLLLREKEKGVWETLLRPAKRLRLNDIIVFREDFKAKVIDKTAHGLGILQFFPSTIKSLLPEVGGVPLPHYIKKEAKDFSDYQTVYAKEEGAVAAPTAGLHFTNELIQELIKRKVRIGYVTLHCGLATFRPINQEDIRNHRIESEWIEVRSCVAEIINETKKNNKKLIAVGTTAVRILESLAFLDEGKYLIKPYSGETSLYIVPGFKFKMVDALITNFHTPYSTNLIMVSAFTGFDLLKESYLWARDRNFRFYSFGDAMLIS